MWHLTRTAIQRWMQMLLHTHDTPERTAAAFALGVAISFSPFLGFHSLIAITLAFLFNLNRVAVLAGSWINLPWFMGPYYAAATVFGSWFTRTPMPPKLVSQLQAIGDLPSWGDRFTALGQLLKPLMAPYLVGSLIGCVVLGFLAYRLTLAAIHARIRHQHSTGSET